MPKPTDPAKWTHMFTDDIKFSQKVLIEHPDDNTFLVLQRSSESKTHPLYWDFAGGNVLYGEDALDSIVNEISEETQLEVSRNISPLLVDASLKEDRGFYRIFIGYQTKALNNTVQLSNEHCDYKWVTKEEFFDLQTVDILKEMVNKYEN